MFLIQSFLLLLKFIKSMLCLQCFLNLSITNFIGHWWFHHSTIITHLECFNYFPLYYKRHPSFISVDEHTTVFTSIKSSSLVFVQQVNIVNCKKLLHLMKTTFDRLTRLITSFLPCISLLYELVNTFKRFIMQLHLCLCGVTDLFYPHWFSVSLSLS